MLEDLRLAAPPSGRLGLSFDDFVWISRLFFDDFFCLVRLAGLWLLDFGLPREREREREVAQMLHVAGPSLSVAPSLAYLAELSYLRPSSVYFWLSVLSLAPLALA